jgi:head-tail adaptor
MGWGVGRVIKLVTMTEGQGVDGIEPMAEEVATLYAQVNTISQSRGFDANKANYKTSYEFLIRYDTTLDINVAIMIEYNNRRYSTQTIERVDRVRAKDKFASQVIVNPQGRYWRVVATSEDIS